MDVQLLVERYNSLTGAVLEAFAAEVLQVCSRGEGRPRRLEI